MPYTVGQLSPRLSSYVATEAVGGPGFTAVLNQVLERIHGMGLWRDLTYETVLPVAKGKVVLPNDAETVISYLFDDVPLAKVRPLWYDYMNRGRHENGTTASGLVDDGWHVGAEDLDSAGGYTVRFTPADADTPSYEGTEQFVVRGILNDLRIRYEIIPEPGDTMVSASGPIDTIHSIQWNNVHTPVRVHLSNTDPDLDVQEYGTIDTPEGVLRTRRFRVPGATDGQTEIRVLLKRRFVPVSSDEDIVHIVSINALKHGLLAVLAEDSADLERATYHWNACRSLLDEDLDSATTGHRFTVGLDMWGGQPAIATAL